MRRVLAVDGGGIRGILPAVLLQTIETRMGKPCASLFDLLSGTSTGGIIACGLARGVPAQTLVDLYVKHGGEVFSRTSFGGIFDPKYNPGPLEARLKATLGETVRLKDVAGPELLVPAYCVQLPRPTDTDGDGIVEGAASWFFKSWRARENVGYDFPLWQVARATSAAPTYFPTALIEGGYWMVDGGVFANNPAMCAAAAAKQLWPDDGTKVLSIGTGSKVAAISGASSANWGVSQWAPHIASVFMDGAADSVSYLCNATMGANFLRCEIALSGCNDAFDDASVENIAALEKLAAAFVDRHIDRVVTFLS